MEAFDTHLNALRFYVATWGNIDYICTLLREAIILALQSREEQISVAHVTAAWDTGICAKVSLAPENPFLRELVIGFGRGGYVALFEVEDAETVTVLAVRHRREDDYH